MLNVYFFQTVCSSGTPNGGRSQSGSLGNGGQTRIQDSFRSMHDQSAVTDLHLSGRVPPFSRQELLYVSQLFHRSMGSNSISVRRIIVYHCVCVQWD